MRKLKSWKSTVSIVVSALLALSFPAAVFAERETYYSYNISSATGATSGSGFAFAKGGDGTATLLDKPGGGKYIKIENPTEGSTAVNVLYDLHWSAAGRTSLLFDTTIMTEDTLATKKTITFRTAVAGQFIEVLNFTGTALSCFGEQVSGFSVEAGQWYDVTVALRMEPQCLVELYMGKEGENKQKVASVPCSYIPDIAAANLQLRVETWAQGTFCISDSVAYGIKDGQATVLNSALTALDESVNLSFDVPADPDSLANLSVEALVGTVPEYTVSPVYGDSGLVTGASVQFAQPLMLDNEYAISLDGVTDLLGQSYSGTLTFQTPEPEEGYSWNGGPKLSVGGTAVNSLQQGDVTVTLAPVNNGAKSRPVTLVCALYQNDVLTQFGYQTMTLGMQEAAELSVTIPVAQVDADTRLEVMTWQTATGGPLAAHKVFQ